MSKLDFGTPADREAAERRMESSIEYIAELLHIIRTSRRPRWPNHKGPGSQPRIDEYGSRNTFQSPTLPQALIAPWTDQISFPQWIPLTISE